MSFCIERNQENNEKVDFFLVNLATFYTCMILSEVIFKFNFLEIKQIYIEYNMH